MNTEIENNILFWQKLDTLVLSSTLSIERKKGDRHPDYYNLIYPLDYGHLKDSAAQEADEIEVYVGSHSYTNVQSLIISVDVLQKSIEAKILLGCDEQEEHAVVSFLNETDFQKTIIVHRGKELPEWAVTEN